MYLKPHVLVALATSLALALASPMSSTLPHAQRPDSLQVSTAKDYVNTIVDMEKREDWYAHRKDVVENLNKALEMQFLGWKAGDPIPSVVNGQVSACVI
jgi:hypothetical protein